MTERADGVLYTRAQSGEELAMLINQAKKEYAVTATQIFQPNDTSAVWSAFIYYARKFPTELLAAHAAGED